MKPQHILIIRLSAIGDVVFASGLPTVLRTLYPDARITWLAEPAVASMLRENNFVDEVLVWDRRQWSKWLKSLRFDLTLRAFFKLRSELRTRRFDLVLDVQGLLKSAIWARLTGAKDRIGLGSYEGSHRLMTQVCERPNRALEIASEYAYLAKYLGFEGLYQLNVDTRVETERTAMARLNEMGIAQGQPYLAIAPFSTRPQKFWFDEHWEEFAGMLKTFWNQPVLFLGGPGDRDHGAVLAAKTGWLDLTGKTSIPEAAAIIKNASAMVGVDTGLTHIAVGAHTPVVGIWGSTRPYMKTPGYPKSKLIYLAKSCSPCWRKPTCDNTYHCLKDIRPQMVRDALKEVL